MSFAAFVLGSLLLSTGAIAALVKPRVLVVHTLLIAGWVAYEFPLWTAKAVGYVVAAGLVCAIVSCALYSVLEHARVPRIPWTRGERLQRRVRHLSVADDEEGFGQEWATFAARRGFALASCDEANPVADPGNPGRLIATWTSPWLQRRDPSMGRYLLLMVDASPHRARSPRRSAPTNRYGLYAEISTDPDPLAAQASSWRVPRHIYAATRRAT